MTYEELIIQIASAEPQISEELAAEICKHVGSEPIDLYQCERLLTRIIQYHISQSKKLMKRTNFEEYLYSIEEAIISCEQQTFVVMVGDQGLFVLKALDASEATLSFEMLHECIKKTHKWKTTASVATTPSLPGTASSVAHQEQAVAVSEKQASKSSIKKLNKALRQIREAIQTTYADIHWQSRASEVKAMAAKIQRGAGDLSASPILTHDEIRLHSLKRDKYLAVCSEESHRADHHLDLILQVKTRLVRFEREVDRSLKEAVDTAQLVLDMAAFLTSIESSHFEKRPANNIAGIFSEIERWLEYLVMLRSKQEKTQSPVKNSLPRGQAVAIQESGIDDYMPHLLHIGQLCDMMVGARKSARPYKEGLQDEHRCVLKLAVTDLIYEVQARGNQREEERRYFQNLDSIFGHHTISLSRAHLNRFNAILFETLVQSVHEHHPRNLHGFKRSLTSFLQRFEAFKQEVERSGGALVEQVTANIFWEFIKKKLIAFQFLQKRISQRGGVWEDYDIQVVHAHFRDINNIYNIALKQTGEIPLHITGDELATQLARTGAVKILHLNFRLTHEQGDRLFAIRVGIRNKQRHEGYHQHEDKALSLAIANFFKAFDVKDSTSTPLVALTSGAAAVTRGAFVMKPQSPTVDKRAVEGAVHYG